MVGHEIIGKAVRVGKDVKHTQLKRGNSHNCRIDETIQLEVTGDQASGQSGCQHVHCSVDVRFGVTNVFNMTINVFFGFEHDNHTRVSRVTKRVRNI